jgi:hypothetical protein
VLRLLRLVRILRAADLIAKIEEMIESDGEADN